MQLEQQSRHQRFSVLADHRSRVDRACKHKTALQQTRGAILLNALHHDIAQNLLQQECSIHGPSQNSQGPHGKGLVPLSHLGIHP